MSIFGLKVVPKPPVLRPRPFPKIIDVRGPGNNTCGRIARNPTESYHVQYYDYVQKKRMIEEDYRELIRKRNHEDATFKKYDSHFEHKSYDRILNKKVNKKLMEYEIKIEERRKKLSEIISKEEREYLKEIVDQAQKCRELRMEERLGKIDYYIEKEQTEREEIVKQKKMQQDLARCAEFRPLIAKQRGIEAKKVNLIQIKENESRRKSEKELDCLWFKLNQRHCIVKDEREEEEIVKKLKQKNEFKFYAELQAKEKLGKNQKRQQEISEEHEQLVKLRENIENQDKLEAEMKRKKNKEIRESFLNELKDKRERLQRATDKELNIQRNYEQLAAEELAKEQAALKAKVSTAHEDMIQFKSYLNNFREERDEEIRRIKDATNDMMQMIQKRNDDAKIEAEMARKALLQNVLKERAEQVEIQKKQRKEVERITREEQELARQTQEFDRKLKLEYDRQNYLKAKEYREALEQQLSYKRILQEREKENEKRILDASVLENDKYNKIVADVMSGEVKVSETHNFRRVIDEQKCPCLKPIY